MFVRWQVIHKHFGKSFINKPTFSVHDISAGTYFFNDKTTNYWSTCVPIRFFDWIDSYLICLASLSISLRYKNHVQKNLFQWRRKAYLIGKLEGSDSNPVWWKHSINVGTNELTHKEKTQNNTLSMFTVSKTNLRQAFQKSLKYFISHMQQYTF